MGQTSGCQLKTFAGVVVSSRRTGSKTQCGQMGGVKLCPFYADILCSQSHMNPCTGGMPDVNRQPVVIMFIEEWRIRSRASDDVGKLC